MIWLAFFWALEFQLGFWWDRKLLTGFQRVSMVSLIKDSGLAFDGVEGFYQRSGMEYRDKKRDTWIMLNGCWKGQGFYGMVAYLSESCPGL